jgi:predicted MFS family arabinose efflux permease
VVGGWLLNHYWWGSVFLINVPLVAGGLGLLAWLLPDIPGDDGQQIDLAGILLSSAGLIALTYGLVRAGDQGWGSAAALVPMLAGAVLLATFLGWQRRARHPLVDMRLFASPGFRWGVVLATIASFALMGAMFLLPQYFQAVFGSDALGTGLRLLPVVGGLLVGVQIADRLRPRLGAKIVVSLGFVLMAAGLVTGTTTATNDGYGFVAVWVSLIGLGLGFSLPPAMDIAMGALTADRGGVGSGLLQALRQVGGTLGVAILGTVLNAGYRSQLDGLPAPVAGAVRDSPAAGVRAAGRVPALLESVRGVVLHGMSGALWVCAVLAAIGAVLTVTSLPRRAEAVSEAESEHDYAAA